MKYIKQFGIITGVTLTGELIKLVLPLPIPASVWGLVLMLFLLSTKLIKVDAVKGAGNFLIQVMPLMFVPPAVALILSWEQLRGILVPFIVIVVVTTVLVMGVAGKITEIVLRKKKNDE